MVKTILPTCPRLTKTHQLAEAQDPQGAGDHQDLQDVEDEEDAQGGTLGQWCKAKRSGTGLLGSP